MELANEQIRTKLSECGLKVTPQRVAILEAIYKLNNHPTVENIIEYIRQKHPNVATGTVYKVLETFTEKALIKKVTTDGSLMRYDGAVENHHHLYCTECELIEDYVDSELDELLNNYFEEKKIKGFEISDFSLQIKGTFSKC